MSTFLIALLLSFGLSMATIESTDFPPAWNTDAPTEQDVNSYIVEDDVDGG